MQFYRVMYFVRKYIIFCADFDLGPTGFKRQSFLLLFFLHLDQSKFKNYFFFYSCAHISYVYIETDIYINGPQMIHPQRFSCLKPNGNVSDDW